MRVSSVLPRVWQVQKLRELSIEYYLVVRFPLKLAEYFVSGVCV
ncbi:hypothetical protein CA13_51180 [Planctomycetes bacterium CA13]|uniref:Uncharacterized protein n=1 Tax=Novipirellula herctigrandis TaxID=2527986 RepID=A0A5C5ZA25_9BACT|nr:hypothetical protein CA13_51180 [Planctomycetes bacterium CA13]